MIKETLRSELNEHKLHQLQLDWHKTVLSSNPQADANLIKETFDDIRSRYSQPWRYYHTLFHIYEFTQLEQKFIACFKDPARIKRPKWLHDIFYDPKSKVNEENSAKYGGELFRRLGVPDNIIIETQKYILASKTHTLPEGEENHDLAFFLDFDLWILASPQDRYQQYIMQLRAEYEYIPGTIDIQKRINFLENMLARKKIFNTSQMRREYENQARVNMEKERAQLKNST